MPGSPPRTVTEPGTSPPWSTRSSSPTWVADGTHAAASTSAIGRGTAPEPVFVAVVARVRISSTSDPHASQAEHRPAHWGSWAPHSWQRYVVFARAMGGTLRRRV